VAIRTSNDSKAMEGKRRVVVVANDSRDSSRVSQKITLNSLITRVISEKIAL